jgi:hypothetical protein
MVAALWVALLIAIPAGLQAQANTTESIACGSSADARSTCQIHNGSATTVRLTRDLSGRCRQGSTWGYTARSVWTSGGCRGEFGASFPAPITRRITCGRAFQGETRCETDGFATSVRLVREASNNRCRQGSTWGNSSSQIWVRDRCMGEFEVTYRGDGGSNTRVINCGSNSGDASCNPSGRVQSVRLLREQGNRRCRQGVTWGYSEDNLWTKSGCQGEFQITYNPMTPQPR